MKQSEFDKHEERVYNSLERIENKLDSLTERVVRTEEKVKNQQGAIKLSFSALLAVVSSVVIYAFKKVFGGE